MHYECKDCGYRMDMCTCDYKKKLKKRSKPSFKLTEEQKAVQLLRSKGYKIHSPK